ncbi:MAG: glycoside hydrolase family 57 protein [Planctomycetota bacterium]
MTARAPRAAGPATAAPTAVVPYFQVHQPFRLRRYTYFDIGVDARWFDDAENERIVRRVAERCYVPTNALLLRLVHETEGRFRCAFSVSGTAIEQMERWAPEALEGFVALARTGCVEVLGETSHHSLAFLADDLEFRAQVADQAARVERVFGRRPTAFRNTELVIDEHVARTVEDLGFVALLGEGSDGLLGWRSPARVYGVEGCERLRLLLRHYRLSDDIAFRFSNRAWDQWPLTAEKFARSLAALPADDVAVNLFMDYETFGEHQWKETGIFDFLAAMPRAVLADPRFAFRTPTEVATAHAPAARLPIPHPISWADAERDLGAWLGNPMQRAANLALYALLPAVRASGRADLVAAWRRLSTSDHLYYMFTKRTSDGDVHEHFSPYASPHDAFIAFMNVLDDLERRAGAAATDAVAAGTPPASAVLPPAPARAPDPLSRPLPPPPASPATGAAQPSKRSRRRVPRGG